jgi:hypothetical protein
MGASTVSSDIYPHIYLNGVLQSVTVTPFKSTGGWYGATLQGQGLSVAGVNSSPVISGGQATFYDLKIWDTPLTTSDFQSLHAGSTPTIAPVLNYPFSDGPQLNGGVNDGDVIAGWKTKNNLYSFNQITLASRPTFVKNVSKGQAGLRFDGVDDHLLKSLRTLNGSSGVFFAVVKPKSLDSRRLFSQSDGSTNTGYKFFGISSTGYIANSVLTGVGDTETVVATVAIATTTLSLYTFKSDGSVTTIAKNGSTVNNQVLSGVNTGDWFSDVSTVTVTTIGALIFNSSVNTPWSGDICELISYEGTKTPNSNAIENIKKYLMDKYGIST